MAIMVAPAVLLFVLFSSFCTAWAGTAPDTDRSPTTEDSVKHIMAVQEKLSSINRKIEREKFLAEQAPPSERGARNSNVAKLQEIKFIHQRLLNTLKKNISLAADEVDLKKEIESVEVYILEEKPPYSLSFYDKLLDRVAGVQQEKDVLSTSIKSDELKLDESKKNLEKTEQAWRRIKEETEAKKGEEAESDLQYLQAQLEREAARAALELQEARQDLHKKEMRLADLKLKSAQQKLEMIRKEISLDPSDRLGRQKNKLNERLQSMLD
ncbi:MAG: hypothetical protein C4519_01375 [Desulfobacteraceae bacterium]|nr:MAG: hypothetical protein C4519_01375 [Desulfobacteraceae bacterium]